jgi:acyl-CoA dehydrogenase
VQFELTETQREIQKMARKFAEKEFDPVQSMKLEKEGSFPKATFEKACRLGLVGIDYPEEFGGQSMGFFERVLVMEEWCRKDSGIGISVSLADMGSGIILRHGDEEQKKRYLIPVTEGKSINTVAITDALDEKNQPMTTRAEEGPSEVVVDGRKAFVLHGSTADMLVAFCQSKSSAGADSPGPMAVIIERNQEGVSVSGEKKMMGVRMSSVHEVTFSNVRIPRGRVIGRGGQGGDYLTAHRTEQSIRVSAMALGIAQGALEQTVKQTNEREQFGRRIVEFQGIQFMLADLYTQIEAARSLVYRAAYSYDTRATGWEKIASAARLFASDVAVKTTIDSIQIHGGIGLMREFPIERMFRDAKTIQNFGETNLVQRALIARPFISSPL